MPSVIVKDAQRHGLRIKPIDVTISRWECTLEPEPDGKLSLRLGLMYVRGLKQSIAEALVHARAEAFQDVEDLALRVPQLNRRDLSQLARVGALNQLSNVEHRRDAIWQAEQAARPAGPLLRTREAAQTDTLTTTLSSQPEQTNSMQRKDRQSPATNLTASPLRRMQTEERLVADFAGTGLSIDHHPMAYRRDELRASGVLSARELLHGTDGRRVTAAGCVIARQRPGTALGFIFLSMEDETGIANVIIHPNLYDQDRVLITREKFLLVTGRLQNQDGVVHVKAESVHPLRAAQLAIRSHDFH
jgi:error-prone DNA polymerase